jgi:hypothetical protein
MDSDYTLVAQKLLPRNSVYVDILAEANTNTTEQVQ